MDFSNSEEAGDIFNEIDERNLDNMTEKDFQKLDNFNKT